MSRIKPLYFVAFLSIFAASSTIIASVNNALLSENNSQTRDCTNDGDLILTNGKFITMDKNGHLASSVLIRGNRIAALDDDINNQDCATLIDLDGRTVIPGLIDSHLHFTRQGLAPGFDVREAESASSIQTLLEILAQTSGKVPKSQFVSVIGGISIAQFKEKRMPRLKELDDALPNQPVYIQLGFSGPAYTNSQGIKLFARHGIKVNSNGTFKPGKETEKAFAALQTMQSFDDKVHGIEKLMTYANSVGLTTVFDEGGTGFPGASYFNQEEDYKALLALHHKNKMKLRVRIQHTSTQASKQEGAFEAEIKNMLPLSGDSMLKYSGTGEHIVSFPVGGKVNPFYQDRIYKIAALGWSHEQHSVSEAENKQHLEMISKVHKKFPINKLRWSLSHVFELGMEGTGNQLAAIKAMNMGVRVQNHGYTSKTDRFPLGRNLKGDNAGPLYRTLYDLGVPMGAGSDGSLLGPMNPWFSIYYMVTGKNNQGQLVNPDQTLTRLEALKLYTKDNAWFSFEEQDLGSIEAGKLADLVVLDKDYLSISDHEILTIKSMLTIVNGRIVYSGN